MMIRPSLITRIVIKKDKNAENENTPNKLTVQCITEDSKQPSCPHGPCLLFYKDREQDGFYACAAYRDRRDCHFHLPVKLYDAAKPQRDFAPPTEMYRTKRQKILDKGNNYEGTYFCHDCNTVILPEENQEHDETHNKLVKLVANVNSEICKIDPTEFLSFPLENDKAHAQYFFDSKAMNFFCNRFIDMRITKVVCIGAPRLHGHLLKAYAKLNIKSFLLDLDHRFYYFYDDICFAWYNMCNNHFFDEKQKAAFLWFLKCTGRNERVLLFTDPPFGCRTEIISHTLRELTNLYNHINKRPHQPLPLFWVFPYYSAHYIQTDMPHLRMCDYKVNYTNHNVYSDNGVKANRRLGSPVRLFTNVPLELLKLPVEEGYKFCTECQIYTALENRHCMICGTCPSKNGSTYVHCKHCGICVKPNYGHCKNCMRCTLLQGHNCEEYQRKQRCRICKVYGHIEKHCNASFKIRNTPR